ncbi:MAG: hypothetical protein NXY57DRAFT_587533 [Lentinula lateritia]|nr:MAG: hypothetical protein NXY57DRAFT_587533 [Lentinula lateritia]
MTLFRVGFCSSFRGPNRSILLCVFFPPSLIPPFTARYSNPHFCFPSLFWLTSRVFRTAHAVYLLIYLSLFFKLASQSSTVLYPRSDQPIILTHPSRLMPTLSLTLSLQSSLHPVSHRPCPTTLLSSFSSPPLPSFTPDASASKPFLINRGILCLSRHHLFHRTILYVKYTLYEQIEDERKSQYSMIAKEGGFTRPEVENIQIEIVTLRPEHPGSISGCHLTTASENLRYCTTVPCDGVSTSKPPQSSTTFRFRNPSSVIVQ